ncbi:hypothetical protein ABVF61_07865 [Roseibium sp. HPY-6]|uniref:hypothetical protein n=1 Tax=Roseibium sp. HPY-6 TaxID=3229852 RepID=UPI0033900866
MANVLWGVPPDRGSAFDIAKGTYLRMGTYSADPRINMDERVVLPLEYLQDVRTDDKDQALKESEGILFSTRGSYVVETEKTGVIDIGAGISEHVTGSDNDLESKTNQGNILATIEKGNVSIVAKKKEIEIISDDKNIELIAKSGLLTTSAKKTINYTAGRYVKRVLANEYSEVAGTNTEINVGAKLELLTATAESYKLTSVVACATTISFALAPISIGFFALGWNRLSETFVSVDTLYCQLNSEYRTVQLETVYVDDSKSVNFKDARAAKFKSAKWLLKKATVQTFKGLLTTIPGPDPMEQDDFWDDENMDAWEPESWSESF